MGNIGVYFSAKLSAVSCVTAVGQAIVHAAVRALFQSQIFCLITQLASDFLLVGGAVLVDGCGFGVPEGWGLPIFSKQFPPKIFI